MEADFLFHESTKNTAWQHLKEVLATNQPHRIIIKPWKNRRSLSQNSLSHMWYAEISKHLCKNGIKHTDESVKEMMKHTFLGYEEAEMINAVTGDVELIRRLRKTSDLDTGDMYFYMEQVERWAGLKFNEVFIKLQTVIDIPKTTCYDNFKPIFEFLVEDCFKEEAHAEQMLHMVTRRESISIN